MGGVIWEGYIRYEISPGNPVINQIARSDHGIIWMLAPGKPGLQCTVCVSQAPGKAAGCRYIAAICYFQFEGIRLQYRYF